MVEKVKGTISEIKELTSDVRHFVVDLEKEFNFKAGQFVNLSFIHEEISHRKPYSIASHPLEDNKLELCIKLVPEGKSTPSLWKKKEGDEVEIMGPLGLFNLDDHSDKEKLVFIGTGTGIAPLRSMIKHLLKEQAQKEILLIFGVRHEGHHLYENEFEDLQLSNPNFRFVKVLSKPEEKWDGRQGHVHHHFDLIDPLNSKAYICGLPQMVESAKKELLDMGFHEDDIKHEKYV